VGSDDAPNDPRVRIAHVSDVALPRVGGIEIHVAGLAERQRAAGHDVELVTALDGNGRSWQRMRPSVIGAATAAVRNGSFDVVHVHASVFSPVALGVAATASRAGLPTVVTGHSLLARYSPVLRALDSTTRWTRWPVTWSAVSELAAAPIRRLVGDEIAVSVVPNAIDVARWSVTPVARDPDHVVIAAVMRLAARKRPLALARALRRARALVPGHIELRAVVVGDGPQRRTLERYCARHGMRDWVQLTGPLNHDAIRRLYQRADLFLNPAVLESFGIAALEARAAGVPVVAMQQSAVGAFVTHGRTGLLAADDRALAESLADLASNARMRARVAAQSRRVAPTFGWDHTLSAAERAYARAGALQGIPPARSVGRRAVAEVVP